MPAPNPAGQNPYPQTGSGRTMTSNQTNTSLSTMIVIKVNDQAVGAVQKLSITEARTIKMIDEVGTDGHIDSAPTASTNITGDCTRIRFERLRIAEAFDRGFLHVKSQRVPFDIHVIDLMGSVPIVTVIQNVWIKQISYGYTQNDWIITDDMQWEAETIFSYLGGSTNQSAAQAGGGRSMDAVPWDVYEVAADVGVRRGAMDAPDLLNAPLSA